MKTALYHSHLSLGAKMIDFCGWEMPIQYKGVIPEHLQVRQDAGVFDISHMGRIDIQGPEAEDLLNYLSTNQLSNKPIGSATYTLWCNLQGGVVDDLIVYKKSSDHFFVIVNACNRDKDLQHLKKVAVDYRVEITDRYQTESILAVQGPNAIAKIQPLFPQISQLKPMHFTVVNQDGKEVVLSLTGYTGAGGCEIYGTHSDIVQIWDQLITSGVQPIGLGARDTLRLEMGFALYGHELTETMLASETIANWTIKWEKEFYGKKALLKSQPPQYYQTGIILVEPGIARAGYQLFKNDQQVGIVTSGNYSPSLNKSIAIVHISKEFHIGELIEVQIRQQRVKAQIVAPTFLQS